MSAREGTGRLSRIFSTIVEESPTSVVITDPRGNIEFVNRKFTRITGYSREEVIGKNPRILKPVRISEIVSFLEAVRRNDNEEAAALDPSSGLT